MSQYRLEFIVSHDVIQFDVNLTSLPGTGFALKWPASAAAEATEGASGDPLRASAEAAAPLEAAATRPAGRPTTASS